MLLFYPSNVTPFGFEYAADRMADGGPKRHTVEDLLTVMARLRDPVSGCPWDVQHLWHHRPLHYRRGLRGLRRYRAGRPRCAEGRTRRSPASGRLSRPDGFGAEAVRIR